MSFAPLFSSIGIMACVLGIGAMIGRSMKVTIEARQLLISIILNVAVPCIILNGVFQSPQDGKLLSYIFLTILVSVALNCAGMLLAYLFAIIFRIPVLKRKEFTFIAGLGNTGFIGLPLCAALFGPLGGLLAAIYDAGLDLVIWTVGVFVLQGGGKFSWKQLRSVVNIPMIAIVVGLVLAWTGYQPPVLVKSLTAMLSSLAAPLAMLYIGILIPQLLGQKKMPSYIFPIISVAQIVKLMIYPLAVATTLLLLQLPLEIAQVTLIMSAMPTITLASIMFAKYAADENLGVAATVFSTIISLITIPFVVMLGNYIVFS
ncbi:AEC family transporter [Brevibacillus daliensis]|uniref:AEC family transporter n=1 Tax=Brevibacillus daliensis TaxID=2892995 RepID=UPI001E5AC9AE|nr:AEC family transporter [Brevibacillus daliensis]